MGVVGQPPIPPHINYNQKETLALGIEIYEQDKYATHVVTSKGEIKYECSARNVAEAIVKEHNKHNSGEPWRVGTTVTLVSAKNIAWRAEASIDWDKVKTGKNAPAKCVKVTASETQTNLQVSKPKVSATYLLSDGDKPENYMRWHATASDKDVAMVLAKQAAVKALEAYLEKIGKTVKTSVKPTVKPSGKVAK